MNLIMKFGLLIGIIILVVLAIVMPILYIWAFNTLFALSIPYTIETWSAVILLQMFFHYSISIKKKD